MQAVGSRRHCARGRKAVTRLPVIDTSPFVEQRGLDERRAVAIGHSFFDLPPGRQDDTP